MEVVRAETTRLRSMGGECPGVSKKVWGILKRIKEGLREVWEALRIVREGLKMVWEALRRLRRALEVLRRVWKYLRSVFKYLRRILEGSEDGQGELGLFPA